MIFPRSRDFAGFVMRKLLYLDAETTDFDSKTRFGKFIRFYSEIHNKKIQFEIILVVYGVTGVNRRWKITNLGQMFDSQKIKYQDPFSHIWFIGKLMVLIRLHEKFRTFNFFHYFWLEIDRNSMMADIDSHFEGVRTFFLWKFLILSHFLNLKTLTDDSRLRHCLNF